MKKRNGSVFTQIVKNVSKRELMPIINSRATTDSTIFTDGFKAYDGLADYGYTMNLLMGVIILMA